MNPGSLVDKKNGLKAGIMVSPNDSAKKVMDKVKYITVATVDGNGQPWNTPVAGFHFDNDYTLYWASWQNNQHSKNIRSNNKIFIVIYDSTPTDAPTQGVYIQAIASELNEEEEVMQAALVFGNDPYNTSDGKEYLNDKPRRVYKAVPQKIWVNSDSEITGNFIDIRVLADE